MNGLAAKVHNGAAEGLILGGDLIAQRAAGKAPADTGRLRRSITRGNPYTTANGQAIGVGTNLEYAPFQELGTKFMDPHPYLRPAIEESEKEVAVLIAKRIVAKMVKL